ncbi:hypothetical protein OSH11_01515 [Kaistia dalseonensis]|uniref:Secreted protein n=1 Tax=Kaistia dalseonensis TaxID=410840 RepID=A0ABU0H0U7_9HYPH|nr:hypothetical protein [Kaistia dalseonensis]MCX5493373.1 hypothetical protein [Kaistia dalseonensis]MDQ0435931.1 hypothetical protein [Kaistia dalseonensis]
MNRIRALRAVFLVSAATVLLVNLGLTAIPCTAAATEDGGSGVAGQLAKWSLGQAGGLVDRLILCALDL